MKKNEKSIIKDIAILLSVWVPLIFVVVGGVIYLNDGFNGTFMEKLFPAIFLGFVSSFISMIIISNLFKNSKRLWIITAILVFLGTVIAYMLDVKNFIVVELIIISCTICLLSLVTIIMEKFNK